MLVKKIPEKSTPNQIDHLSIEERLVWPMEEYGDMVIRLAFTYVKQKQLAEDISQEVFISCYKNMDKFYKTWIYKIEKFIYVAVPKTESKQRMKA